MKKGNNSISSKIESTNVSLRRALPLTIVAPGPIPC